MWLWIGYHGWKLVGLTTMTNKDVSIVVSGDRLKFTGNNSNKAYEVELAISSCVKGDSLL